MANSIEPILRVRITKETLLSLAHTLPPSELDGLLGDSNVLEADINRTGRIWLQRVYPEFHSRVIHHNFPVEVMHQMDLRGVEVGSFRQVYLTPQHGCSGDGAHNTRYELNKCDLRGATFSSVEVTLNSCILGDTTFINCAVKPAVKMSTIAGPVRFEQSNVALDYGYEDARHVLTFVKSDIDIDSLVLAVCIDSKVKNAYMSESEFKRCEIVGRTSQGRGLTWDRCRIAQCLFLGDPAQFDFTRCRIDAHSQIRSRNGETRSLRPRPAPPEAPKPKPEPVKLEAMDSSVSLDF